MKPFIYKFGLQQQYDDLRLKDEQTMYIITDTHKIYIGEDLYTSDPDLSNYVTKTQLQNAISNINIQPSEINYSEATQTSAGLMSAADKIKLDSIPENGITYNKATSISDGLMSKQHFNKLENDVLTTSNLIICTNTQYNNTVLRPASLYIVISGEVGKQTLQFKDNLGNIIDVGGKSSIKNSSNLLLFTSALSSQNTQEVVYSNEQTEQEWNTI